jgi:hypothetical protein
VINPLCCQTTIEHVGLSPASHWNSKENENQLWPYIRFTEGRKEVWMDGSKKGKRKGRMEGSKEKREKEEEEEEEEEAKEEDGTLHKNTDTFHPSMLLESRWWRMPRVHCS